MNVVTSIPQYVLMNIVVKSASNDTIGEASLSPSFKYLLCVLLLVHDLPFIVSSSFSSNVFTASKYLYLFSEVSLHALISSIAIFRGMDPWCNCFSYLILSATESYQKRLETFVYYIYLKMKIT